MAVDSITTRKAIKKKETLNTLNDINIIINRYRFILSIINRIFRKLFLNVIFNIVIK